MRCPKCSKPSEVIKVYQHPTEARRRRECMTCGLRFSTSERVWKRVYVEEIKNKPLPKGVRHHVKEERPKRTYSNFDVVALEGYDMEQEDVTTYVHVTDD
jgi:transcriptional regulator NrdR family protein